MEENKHNFDNEEEEDEDTHLRKLIDETYKKIEESKKTITKRNEEGKKETEKGVRYEMIINEKKDEICIIEESIKLINEKIGESYKEKKFIDVLKNKKTDIYEECMFETLKYIKQVEASEVAKNWVKDWEVINSEKILSTEKLKMMKYLGHFFESAEKLFDIDNLTFNNMQHKIEKIFSKEIENKDSPDIKVTNSINIKVYLKEILSKEEIESKMINLSDSDYTVYNISVIDYNYLYEITNKYKVIAIKSLSCKYFSLDEDAHLLVNEEMLIWPYDIFIYDEIFLLNLEKEYVKHHSKFFQLTPNITEGLKFVLINKKNMIDLCMIDINSFKFVENSKITRESRIASYMRTKIIEVETTIKVDRELEKKLKEEKRRMTKDIIKERILKMVKEFYDDESFRSNQLEKSAMKGEELLTMNVQNKNQAVFHINTVNTNEYDLPSDKRKKQRNFKKIKSFFLSQPNLITNTSKKDDRKVIIPESIKNKLNLEYADILAEFKMDVNNFIDYINTIIQNKKNISDFIIDEEKEERDLNYNPDDRLYRTCIDVMIYNKENSLIPQRRLLFDRYEQEQEYYIGSLVDAYLRKEEDQRKEIRDVINAKAEKDEENEERADEFDQDEEEITITEVEAKKNEDYDDRIPRWMRHLEFFVIIFYLLFNHYYINIVEVSDISFFTNKMVSVFDLKNDCTNQLRKIHSPIEMNFWIYNCYVPT